MRVGIDLSANNTYIQFSFEKSLRKYQQNPHKKVKCSLSSMKQKQSCSHCIQKINKVNSIAYSQRASILKESRKRQYKKSRERAKEFSQQRNKQNIISADRSRYKLTTHLQENSLKEISNFNISQDKGQKQKIGYKQSQFQYTLHQKKLNQKEDQKRNLNEDFSTKQARDYSYQDQSFSNIELSQVKCKAYSGVNFNINFAQPQSINKQYDNQNLVTKEYLKEEQQRHKCTMENQQKMQFQGDNCQQEFQSAVQGSYFCFSQSSDQNIQGSNNKFFMCGYNPSICKLQTPKKNNNFIAFQIQSRSQNAQNNNKNALQQESSENIQKIQIQTKKQIFQQAKKQYRQRVIYKLQRINDLESNCMQCQRYSLQIKETIKVELQKMDEEFRAYPPQRSNKEPQCQLVGQHKNESEQKMVIQSDERIEEQHQQTHSQQAIENQKKQPSINLIQINHKMPLKRQRRQRNYQYKEEEVWNFGRLKLNKVQNNQILCVSMRSLNKFIQSNWTVQEITQQIISRRPYLQKNQRQIGDMVRRYQKNYKSK